MEMEGSRGASPRDDALDVVAGQGIIEMPSVEKLSLECKTLSQSFPGRLREHLRAGQVEIILSTGSHRRLPQYNVFWTWLGFTNKRTVTMVTLTRLARLNIQA